MQETNSISCIYTRVCATTSHCDCTFSFTGSHAAFVAPADQSVSLTTFIPICGIKCTIYFLYAWHNNLLLHSHHGDVALPHARATQWEQGSARLFPLLVSCAVVPASGTVSQAEKDHGIMQVGKDL